PAEQRTGARSPRHVDWPEDAPGVKSALLLPLDAGVATTTLHSEVVLAEVEGQQQVDLAFGGLFAPIDVAGAQVLRRLFGGHRVVHAEERLEEVLIALGRGAQRVRPPHRPDARIVVLRVRILGGEPQATAL